MGRYLGGKESNEPYFCSKCQQVVPAGRANNHMKFDSVKQKWVKCE